MAGAHGWREHRPDPARMAAHLRTALQLRPDQDGALQAFVASMQPPAGEAHESGVFLGVVAVDDWFGVVLGVVGLGVVAQVAQAGLSEADQEALVRLLLQVAPELRRAAAAEGAAAAPPRPNGVHPN